MKTIIGGHASISKGILNAIKYTQSIGGNTLQIFLGSNQSTSLKMKTKISDTEIERVREYLKEHNMILVIHTVYLLNFCNHPPSSSQIKYALDNLIFDIELTGRLGGIGCVLHIGYQKDLPEDEAYTNMVENVKYAIDATGGNESKNKNTSKNKLSKNVKIILETPAGKGSQIGTQLEEFARIWNMFPKSYINSGRLGICVDTAHIFSSGRDISTIKGTQDYLEDFDRMIGRKHLTVFHINDSKALCNSRKDLHEGLGDGYIYGKGNGTLKALKALWKYAHKYEIPMILETHGGGGPNSPKDNGKYAQEIGLFRKWEQGLSPEKSFKLKHTLKKSDKSKSKPIKEKKSKTTSKTDKPQRQSPTNYKKYKNNQRIVKIFTELSDIYNAGLNNIKKNAYQKAVYQLKRYPSQITSGSQLLKVEGIGKKMAEKIDEILETNKLQQLEDFRKGATETNKLELETVLGFGNKKALMLKETYNIETISQLKKALKDDDKLMKLTKQQEIGLMLHSDLKKKVTKKEAIKITQQINNVINKNTGELLKQSKITTKTTLTIELAGSLSPENIIAESKDIDILITVSNSKIKSKDNIEASPLLPNIVSLLEDKGIITHPISVGGSKFLGVCRLNTDTPHRHLDIRLVNTDSHIFAKLYYISGRNFNRMMRGIAKKKGYKLNEWGLYKNDKSISVKNEKDIFKLLEMDYVPPQDRR